MFLETLSSFVPRAALAVVIAGACAERSVAQEEGGSESIELRELKTALEVAQAQHAEAETRRQAVVESLAEAVRVSEEQMVDARETKLKLQAFGVDLFTQDEDSLEQRLLKAVRDLDISRQENERQATALHELSEAFLKYIKATPDAPDSEQTAAREAVNQAAAALATPSEKVAADDIASSRVVSIDSSIGLVVFDAGRREGLRVGTPITIMRDERPIYTAMIIDVRDAISGALLQEKVADTEDVAVGDGIRLLPNQMNL
ncbi:MAG: hypothetical protein WD342_18775 [Verrucomicrobiales bacterium]